MIVILGAGESGTGAALLAQAQGLPVFVSEYGQIAPRYREQLVQAGIAFEEGGHTEATVLGASEIVKSPGIPDTAPLVTKARALGISVVNELEFAGRYSRAQFIGITGSNGKTTTTLLCYHLLKEAALDVGLGGNVGTSLARQLAQGQDRDWFVLEESSFQLDNMYAFRNTAGVLLNVTKDHMDRYDNSMELYAASKYRVWQNQQPGDWAIAFAENSYAAEGLAATTGGQERFLVSTIEGAGDAWVASDGLVLRRPVEAHIPFTAISLRGKHNYINALCALLAALRTGLSLEQLLPGLATFVNAPHRLEPVATINGVQFVNDSKATNTDAVVYALQSYTEPLVLILGGKDKGNDYSEITSLVPGRVHAIVAMGKDNHKILDAFTGMVPVYDTHSAEEAVTQAYALAQPGWVVLLSPACASFDLFNNYEHRGQVFREAVMKLQENR